MLQVRVLKILRIVLLAKNRIFADVWVSDIWSTDTFTLLVLINLGFKQANIVRIC